MYKYILDYARAGREIMGKLRQRRILLIPFIAICFLLWAGVAQAQRPHSTPKASNAPDDNGDAQPSSPTLQDKTKDAVEGEPMETLKVNVQLATLYFNVKDRHGSLIPGLKKDDFLMFEDGKQQTIKYFAAEASQPLTLGMLIDTSGSQFRVLPMEKLAGAEFLRDVLRPKDLAFVINFDIGVNLIQDYTSDTARLRHAMDKTQINDGGGSGAGGIAGAGQGTIPVSRPKGTLLYDAVFLASNEKLRKESGRKAMILLTDGGDQGSDETLENAIRAAQQAEAICYVIMIADRMNFMAGDSEMHKLTSQTGGRVIDVGNNPDKLRQAFEQIGQELRSQYMIGYTPTNTATDGKYRKMEVKLTNPDYRVQARKGYYAPKE